MGFHGVNIGRCYAEKLSNDFGMTVDTFKYGCDISKYRRLQNSQRSGVVFYARRESARRGFELGLMTLEAFAARRPDIEIHIYGDKIGKLPFAFIDHGRVTPDELNSIYNRCYAGLSLSFTNVSLVALEMLAAGCIPVVNDTIQVRTDLNNSFVHYAPAYPQALAAQLEAVIATQDFESLSIACGCKRTFHHMGRGWCHGGHHPTPCLEGGDRRHDRILKSGQSGMNRIRQADGPTASVCESIPNRLILKKIFCRAISCPANHRLQPCTLLSGDQPSDPHDGQASTAQ